MEVHVKKLLDLHFFYCKFSITYPILYVVTDIAASCKVIDDITN